MSSWCRPIHFQAEKSGEQHSEQLYVCVLFCVLISMLVLVSAEAAVGAI